MPRASAVALWNPSLLALTVSVLLLMPSSGRAQSFGDAAQEDGNDPYRFISARELYRVAATQPFDRQAAKLLSSVTAKLRAGAMPERDDLRGLLLRLDPYRATSEVQTAIDTWARDCADRAKNADQTDVDTDPMREKGDEQYLLREFAAASEQYRKALLNNPLLLDFRNNLALAELHRNNDLIAQLELSIIRCLEPKYLPAVINLTLVAERLGRREWAEELAAEAVALQERSSAARCNAAWFAYADGRIGAADSILQLGYVADTTTNYYRLQTLIDMQREASITPSVRFFSRGLVGVIGVADSWWLKVLAIVVFAFLSIILAAICSSNSPRHPKARSFLLFVLFGSMFYILWWGIPTSGWIAMMIAYCVFFGWLSQSAVKK